MFRFLASILLVIICLPSCETQISRTNNEEDIKDAEAYVQKFYETLAGGDSVMIARSFGGDIQPKNGFKIAKAASDLLGSLERVDIDVIRTKVTTTSNRKKVDFNYRLNVFYTNGIAVEEVRAVTIGDTIKVTSYLFEYDPSSQSQIR